MDSEPERGVRRLDPADQKGREAEVAAVFRAAESAEEPDERGHDLHSEVCREKPGERGRDPVVPADAARAGKQQPGHRPGTHTTLSRVAQVHFARLGDTEPSDGHSAGRFSDPNSAGRAADGAGRFPDTSAAAPHRRRLPYARFAVTRQCSDRK